MKVAMCSIWKNDMGRDLQARMEHLTAKTYPWLRWIWAMGLENGKDDGTFAAISGFVGETCLPIDLWISDETDLSGRLPRISKALATCLAHVTENDDVVLVHESDLVSPADVVERLLAHGKPCVGAWPVLRLNGHDVFYDIWAYRKNGQRFSNIPPYHPQLREGEQDGLCPVDSVGSVWIFPAHEAVQGLTCEEAATLEVCQKLARMGYQFWLDPTIVVRQPEKLWIPY